MYEQAIAILFTLNATKTKLVAANERQETKMPYGRTYSGKRKYRVWVKGRKAATERTMPADSKGQAQIRMANLWGVKSFEIECVWIKDGEMSK